MITLKVPVWLRPLRGNQVNDFYYENPHIEEGILVRAP